LKIGTLDALVLSMGTGFCRTDAKEDGAPVE
jgi:hypothetical protein